MASTSPYQQNDYRAVSTFRPYQLPVNDIFRAISAQDQFWKMGAARVKGVYENALNLKLSKEQNKEIRDNFLKEADKQLDKLSSMDLSDPAIQRQGFDIFKPLFQDEGIVSDDAATRHIEKVNTDALSYRTRENGKYYNQLNHQYALDGANDFLASPDRKAGKQYMERKKEYEPFHDYTAEYEKIIKNCPSSSTKSDSVLSDAGYIQNTSIKERSYEKSRACLEAGLSPKAYRQMQIEGYMNYKGKPDVLARDYRDFLTDGAKSIQNRIQEMTGQLEGVSKSTKLRPEEKKSMVESYTQQLAALNDELNNHNVSVGKINQGDFSDILGNEELISGSLYQYRKILKESYASEFQEYSQSFKADPVTLQRWKFQQDVNMENREFQHSMQLHAYDNNFKLGLAQINHANDMELEALKQLNDTSKGGSGNGSAIVYDPITKSYTINPNISAVPAHFTDKPAEDTKAYQNLNNQLSTINAQSKTNEDFLFNTFKERGESDPAFRDRLVKAFGVRSFEEWKANGNRFNSDGKIVPMSQTKWFKAYMEQNPDDPKLQDWNVMNSQTKLSAQALNQQLEQGEAQVVTNLGIKLLPGETAKDAVSRATRQNISSIAPKTVNGTQVTPQDIQDALEGRGSKVQIRMTDTVAPSGLYAYNATGSDMVQTRDFVVNGQVVKGTDYATMDQMFQSVNRKNADMTDKVNAQRKKVYSNMQFESEPWFMINDEKSTPVSIIKRMLPDSEGKERNIAIEQLDFEGGFKVRIPGLGEEDLKKLQASGQFSRDFIKADENDPELVVIKNAGYNRLPNGMDPVMKQSAYILSVISKGPDFGKAQPGEKVKNSEIEFPIYDNSGVNRTLKVNTFKNIDGSPSFEVSNEQGLMQTFRDPFQVTKYLQDLKNQPQFRK